MSVKVFAPAKINLTLEVGCPRTDGMHPLQGVVVFADVGDTIEAKMGEGLSLNITGDFADRLSERDEENLVLRAARALALSAGISANARLNLEKNLPVASGIGGGSSDAAATLKALNALWSLDLDAASLQEIARGLGADVPVCLGGAPAYITGTGEMWTSIKAPPFAAVLVNPMKQLATPLVYREFDRMKLGADFAAHGAPQWSDRAVALTNMIATDNALTPAAHSILPDVGVVIEALRNDSRVSHAAMSGSGATCFAIVDTYAIAEALAADVRYAHPDWWTIETDLGGA